MIRTLIFFVFISHSLSVFSQEAELIIPKGHTTPITLLDFQEEHLWLASSQGNEEYTIWNYDAEKEIRHVDLHRRPLSYLKFHPVFAHCLSADANGRIISYNIARNRKRSDIQLHEGKINQIVFSNDGSRFFTCSEDGKLKITNYTDFKESGEFIFRNPVRAFLYYPEEDILVISLSNSEIYRLNIETGSKSLICTPEYPAKFLHKGSVSDQFFAVSENGSIYKVNSKSGEVLNSERIPMKVKAIELIGDKLLLAGRGERDIIYLDPENFEISSEKNIVNLKKDLDPYDISVQTIHYSDDKDLLFIPDYDYSILSLNYSEKKLKRHFRGLTERIKEVQIAPNSFTMGVASSKNGIRLYDLREVFQMRTIESAAPSYSVDFSPDGLLMASSGNDSLRIYSSDDYSLIKSFAISGIYPNGNTTFLNNRIFAKKDAIDGISIFDLDKFEVRNLRLKDAFELRSGFPGKYFAVKSGKNKIFVFDTETLNRKYKIKSEDIIDFDFYAPDFAIAVLTKDDVFTLNLFGEKGRKLKSYELPEGFDADKIRIIPELNSFLSWKISVSKDQSNSNFSIDLWSLDSLKRERRFEGLKSTITSVYFDQSRGLLIASSEDGSIKVWSVLPQNNSFSFPASIVPLERNELVTIMDNGVFDASRNAMESMHFVQGTEYISLDQIKSTYYEPKLLSKIFGFNREEISRRREIKEFALYPEIELQHPNTNAGVLGVDIRERNGGLGEVMVWINEKKAKVFSPDQMETTGHIEFALEGHPYLRPNEINKISVRASNQSGDLISDKSTINYIWNTEVQKQETKFYALVVGISDYEGNKLDLEFAAKDALDISEALQKGAERYFGSENVEIINLNSNNDSKSTRPSKEEIVNALQSMSTEIESKDIFLFYFAGHGTQGEGEDDAYYLLTEEASAFNTKHSGKMESHSISDRELAQHLSGIASHRMIMILDACHSGKILNSFNSGIGYLSTKEEKALEKLIDETGMHILAGSESDKVSYETSLYGQGLLTYSLLFGMKGEALRDGEYLDVNRLFQYASSKVPRLASTIGGVQKPVVKLPNRLEQVDIGKYGNEEKSKIQLLSPRPVILPSTFQDEKLFIDASGMGEKMDRELKLQTQKTGADYVFLSSSNFEGAYRLSGRYSKELDYYDVQVKVYRGLKLIDSIDMQGEEINQILQRITKIGLGVIESDFQKLN